MSAAAIPWKAADAALVDEDPAAWRNDPVSRSAITSRRGVARVYWLTDRVRRLTAPYVRATGLEQAWSMFSTPVRAEIYAHSRSIFVTGASTQRKFFVVRRMIFPQAMETRLRPIASIRNSYWDKAVERALVAYWGHLSQPTGSLVLEQRHDHFGGFLRLLARQDAGSVGAGWRHQRTEVWVAAIPITPRARRDLGEIVLDRQRRLQTYYSGTLAELQTDSGMTFPGTTEDDGGILWTFVAGLESTH